MNYRPIDETDDELRLMVRTSYEMGKELWTFLPRRQVYAGTPHALYRTFDLSTHWMLRGWDDPEASCNEYFRQ